MKDEEKFLEVISTMNQGDIALLKSIFDDREIDYYVMGENFLSMRPLVEPVKFFVSENQLEEVKEILKDFELHIWGTSTNEEED